MDTTPKLPKNDPPAPPKKRSSCRLGCSLGAVFVLVLLGMGYRFVFDSPPLRISEETTRIIGPLAADGQIDFFKAMEEWLNPKEMATDENGYRLFVRAFGPLDLDDLDDLSEEDRECYRLQKYEKLDLDPTVGPSLSLPEKPYAIIEKHCKETGEEAGKYFDKLDAPWTVEELPMLGDWIAQVDVPLDAVAEMVRRPVFFSPLLNMPEAIRTGEPGNLLGMPLPHHFFRELTRQFRIRAMYRIAAGNIDGAVDDAITMLQLGRKIGDRGILVVLLAGISIENSAVSLPLGGNPEYPPTAEQLQRFLDAMDALPPRPPLSTYCETERIWGLSAVQEMLNRPQNLRAKDSDIRPVYARLRCDANTTFRMVNEMYDAMVEGRSEKYMQDFERKLENSRSWINIFLRYGLTAKGPAEGRGMAIGLICIALLAPAVDSIEKNLQSQDCSFRMKHLVFALLRYEMQHGKLPESDWPTAIREYLGEEPDRYFSCPIKPSEPGRTPYALVRYAEGKRPKRLDTFLLVELKESVPFAEATISVEELLNDASLKINERRTGNRHFFYMNVGCRDGLVDRFSFSADAKEIRSRLGVPEPEEPAEPEGW